MVIKHRIKSKVVAVLPAYNAVKTLEPFLKQLSQYKFNDIVLVDDCSTDGTYELAKKQPGIAVFRTAKNSGYGGNIKRCFDEALKVGGEVIVEIHPDGEYLPEAIPSALAQIEKGASLVLGNRFTKQTNPLKKGMYWWKYPLIRILNIVHNLLLDTTIPDLHQGFRVYRREFLKTIPYKDNSNDYAFTFEIIIQALLRNVSIASVPVQTQYKGHKRGASFKNCCIYTLETFKVIFAYYSNKKKLK